MSRLVFDMFGIGLRRELIAAALRQSFGSRRGVIASIGRALAEDGLPKFTDPAFDADAALDGPADMVFSYVKLPPAAGQGVA